MCRDLKGDVGHCREVLDDKERMINRWTERTVHYIGRGIRIPVTNWEGKTSITGRLLKCRPCLTTHETIRGKRHELFHPRIASWVVPPYSQQQLIRITELSLKARPRGKICFHISLITTFLYMYNQRQPEILWQWVSPPTSIQSRHNETGCSIPSSRTARKIKCNLRLNYCRWV